MVPPPPKEQNGSSESGFVQREISRSGDMPLSFDVLVLYVAAELEQKEAISFGIARKFAGELVKVLQQFGDLGKLLSNLSWFRGITPRWSHAFIWKPKLKFSGQGWVGWKD